MTILNFVIDCIILNFREQYFYLKEHFVMDYNIMVHHPLYYYSNELYPNIVYW